MSRDGVLLDTNAVIALMSGHPAVANLIVTKAAAYLPVPAVGELYRGVHASTRKEENLSRLEDLLKRLATLPCDATTAAHYGDLKQQLRVKGKPIPENDLWIASIARQHGLTVMTRDQHFKVVPGINLEFFEL